MNDGTDDSAAPYTMTIGVTAVNDPPTGELAIIGQPVFGATLTLDYSAIMDADGLPDLSRSNIDWYHVGTSSTQASQTTTYTLTRKDVGKALTVDMEYEDDDGEKEALELPRWPASGTITAIAPSAPTGLTATANGTTRIDLSWTGPANPGGTDITGYKIEISPNGTDTWTDRVATTGDDNTTYAHTGLAASTTRHYRVSAINTIGTSAASNVDSATTGNTAPTVANTIPDQSATAGTEFSYAFPDTTFTDADSDTLTYMATKADGNPLPTWLTFTAGTRTFSGMPGAADVATVAVKVTASDGKGGSVSDEFDITVRADPLAHCNAGDTNELWCASLTVGTFYDGPNTYLGYASGTGAYGSLAPNTFPYSTATIGVRVLEYEIANHFDFFIERNAGTTPATGLLGSGIYTLEIGTGGTKKSFVTNNPGTGTDFNFRGHGLSWSMGDTVPVKLVRAPNTAPTSADGMVTATEDTVYTFRATDFPFTDMDTGHKLKSVKIVTLPASGTLTHYDIPLTSIDLPQTITTDDLDAVNNALKYSPPANENGDDLASFTFRVNDGGDDSGTHTMTIDVTAVNDTATGQPGITGTAQVGQVLTAAAGTIADPDGLPEPFLTDANTSFQWVRVTSGTDDDISGETASTYTLVAADEGKTIKVKVSFQDAGGGSEGPFTSAATAVVAAADTTPPTVISATVPATPPTGQVVDLRFSENIDVSKLPAISTFTVTADGIDLGVASKGADVDILRVVFSPAVRQGQVVVVTYTDPTGGDDANAIQDTAGNDVATFTTGRNSVPAVTNNSAVAPSAPGAPTGLTATAGGTTQIDLSWTAPADNGGRVITGYKIEISPNGTDTWTDHVATTGDDNTTYAHTGLAASTTRHYRVSAINTIGTSTASNVDDATTTADTTPPTLISADVPNSGFGLTIFMTFDELLARPSEGVLSAAVLAAFTVTADGVEVGLSHGATQGTAFINLQARASSRIRQGQTVVVTYTDPTDGNDADAVQDPAGNDVATFTTGQNSVPAVTNSSTVVPTAPGAPTGLTATASGTTQIDLSWTVPADYGGRVITGYKIEISPNGTDTWTTHLATTGDANTTYAHTGLAAGTTRHYRVSAINTIGPGTASNVDDATTTASSNTAATGAPTISGTARVGQTLTAVTTGIRDDDGLTNVSYTYQWIRVDGGNETDIGSATASTYTLVDDDQGKTIKVKVSFTDDANNAETLTSAATGVVAPPPNTDPPTVSIIDPWSHVLTVCEDVGRAELTVSLDRPVASDLSVFWSTEDDNAKAPDDYIARNRAALIFPAGDTLGTISIRIVDDAVPEDTVGGGKWEVFFVEAERGPGYRWEDGSLTIVEIVDDDVDYGCGNGSSGDAANDALALVDGVTPEVAAAVLLGEQTLSKAQLAALDRLGNRNGRYDIGDLLSWIARCRRGEARCGSPSTDSGAASAAMLGAAAAGRRRIPRRRPRRRDSGRRGRCRGRSSMGGIRHRARVAGYALAMLLAAMTWSCTEGSVGPVAATPDPGFLTVEWSGPATHRDVGVLLELEGPTIDDVRAPGLELYESSAPGPHRIVVAGVLRPGALVQFRVPDRNQFALYRVRVLQVTGEDYGLRDVEEYQAMITLP